MKSYYFSTSKNYCKIVKKSALKLEKSMCSGLIHFTPSGFYLVNFSYILLRLYSYFATTLYNLIRWNCL